MALQLLQHRKTLAVGLVASILVVSMLGPAISLTQKQKTGLVRHGIWEWSLRNCPGAMRNKGYWFALKEVGGFRNASEIIAQEESKEFREGWQYMADNARKFGLDRTCDYAFEQWPAVLYDSEGSEG